MGGGKRVGWIETVSGEMTSSGSRIDLRKQILERVKRLVVKVGTSLLTTPDNYLNNQQIEKLVDQLSQLKEKGYEIILVSSGAIGSGMGRLKLTAKPRSIPLRQAIAAVGQCRLMEIYQQAFGKYKQTVAQVLLTREDFSARYRYLNARNTMLTLLSLGVIPIVNENDTVAVEEIKFGDNDTLSALVANMVEADLLLILTDTGGLYEEDPHQNPSARLLSIVEEITPEIESMAGEPGTPLGTGGMYTKIQAAKIATCSGVPMIVAGGFEERVLLRIFNIEGIGTLFLPREDALTSRKRWIAFSLVPQGEIQVDEGAKKAIVHQGKSLLSSGIREIRGKFEAGELVSLVGAKNVEFARGLVNYSSEEIIKIRGRKSCEIESILGYKYYDEVIHRDNLVILGEVKESGNINPEGSGRKSASGERSV